jgi:hypothetical protein
VGLPPGRVRLATSPAATGSLMPGKTIGIVEVALFAAIAALMPPPATITSTLRSTRSAANAGSLSSRPSVQRYSIVKFCPSTYPVSLSPWWNAPTWGANGPAEVLLRKPITGIAFCCARRPLAAVIAPPSSSISSRRFTR